MTRVKERILVVDDAPTVRELLKLLLKQADYEATAVATVGEAIEAISSSSYDLVIVDKNLDGEDGFEICRAARELCPGTARILVTADQSVESAIQAVEEDIYAYMTKPLRKQEVLLKVRRALDKVRLTRERQEARAEMKTAREALERRTAELEQTLKKLLHTQTQLAESEKLVSVGMLAAGVAHEINNPACFILPNLEYLRRSAAKLGQTAVDAGAEEQDVVSETSHIDRMLDRCQEGVGRIQKVVKTLQLFSRRDLAKPGAVDLHALCLGLLDIVNHELVGRAKLDIDLQPIPPITGRQVDLAQVVLNLLLNARRSIFLKSNEGEQTIGVRTELRDGEVVLRVSDTGPPLSTPGHQTSDFFIDRGDDGQGPGLSLQVVREILDRYGGRLSLTSDEEGNVLEAFFSITRAS